MFKQIYRALQERADRAWDFVRPNRSRAAWAWGVLAGLSLGNLAFGQDLRQEFTAFDFNARLGRGLNLGNTLEAPREGEWGFVLQSTDFKAIADAGFDSVRVPIRWSNKADATGNQISESFLQRIDWVVEQAKQNGLAAIINMHHYDEIYTNPAAHSDRFKNLWRQISTRYKDEPEQSIYFELLNEPNGNLTTASWNTLAQSTLAIVRETNPTRQVIYGGGAWNSAEQLAQVQMPREDRNLIGTFHFYSPFEFTHQGAEWVQGADRWLGTTWKGTPEQKAAVEQALIAPRNWSIRNNRPVFLGEFGAYQKADMASREAWTRFIRESADARNFSIAYWEYGAGFGLYDRIAKTWRTPLLNAMNPDNLFDVDTAKGVSASDLDWLAQQVAAQNPDAKFDLNNDSQNTLKDVHFWLYFRGYGLADSNLDHQVDIQDFVTLRNTFGKTGTWSQGDFNVDGRVDLNDFIVLRNNFGKTTPALVPEPTGVMVLSGCGLLAWIMFAPQARRRRSLQRQLEPTGV